MFEILQKFVLLVASAACAIFVVWGAVRLMRACREQLKKYRGRKLVRFARMVGARLYTHKVGDSIGICSVRAFKEVADWDKAARPWEPRKRVRVQPTFVFCKDDSLRSEMHVDANAEEVEMLAVELVQKLTGYNFKEVDVSSFSKAVKLLVVTNPQLFVPFAESTSEEEGRRLMEFYGSTPPLYDVRKYLLNQ